MTAANAKYTPGPWEFCGLNKRWGVYPTSAVNDGIDYFIATTRQISSPGREKANARLIAAAPDLVEALRAAHKRLRNGIEMDQAFAAEFIAPAISRATA